MLDDVRELRAMNPPARDATGEKMEVFPSGAKRSEKLPRYDLVPMEGLRRLAERYGMGAERYGEWNWITGLSDKVFVRDMLNHMQDHLKKAMIQFHKDGLSSQLDDDLAAIAWGAFGLMEYQVKVRKTE